MKHRIHEIFQFKKTPGEGFCRVKGCREAKALDGKGNVKKLGLCHGHYQYAWRLCNREKSAYAALRDHASDRKIAFTISYDYFLGLCDGAGFWHHKAENFKDQLSIDRLRAEEGYIPGNCRVITVSENSAKSNRIDHLPMTVRQFMARKQQECREKIKEELYPF